MAPLLKTHICMKGCHMTFVRKERFSAKISSPMNSGTLYELG